MKFRVLIFATVVMLFSSLSNAEPLAVRGIHFQAPSPDDIPMCADFIRNELREAKLNTLVFEINYRFEYESHPELRSSNPLSREDLQQIVEACEEADIELIPQFNCFGHQSWSSSTFPLLTQYPRFDETPGKYPNNEDIYCRSYCPLHPEVHRFVFGLIDELIEVCQATSFHVGMDEVFLIADEDCPRCGGQDPARIFAQEVHRLYGHLKSKGLNMWMWGDRFLDGHVTGIGKWEASTNDTAPAIDWVPKDIMICDWHYEQALPTAPHFAIKGFPVVSSPWRKAEVALGQLEIIRHTQEHATEDIASRMKGMLHTTWTGMAPFVREFRDPGSTGNEAAEESVECFRALIRKME